MKIAEARSVYSTQIKAYHEQHTILSKSNMEVAKQQGEAMEESVEDPTQIADNAEAFASGPAIVEVTDTMANAVNSESI